MIYSNNDDINKVIEKQRGKGIYLLPNLFTVGTIFGGFYAIVASTQGRFEAAAIAIFIAMVMDGLDGRVARLTNTQSDFGMQFDSLADMVSFGLAPALIIYEWQLKGMIEWGESWGRLGWVAAFIYVAAAALRLARFNVQVESADDKRFFKGLPSPAAAILLVGSMWVLLGVELSENALVYTSLVITLGGGTLMISNVTYYSFKDIDGLKKVPFFVMPAIILFLCAVIISPAHILYTVFLTYVISGPVISIYRQLGLMRSCAKNA